LIIQKKKEESTSQGVGNLLSSSVDRPLKKIMENGNLVTLEAGGEGEVRRGVEGTKMEPWNSRVEGKGKISKGLVTGRGMRTRKKNPSKKKSGEIYKKRTSGAWGDLRQKRP